MKKVNRFGRRTLLAALILGSVAAVDVALARDFHGQAFHAHAGFHPGFHGGHHHGHGGVFIGAPLFWGPDFYTPPPYYAPPLDADTWSPPVYVERGDMAQVPPPPTNWYYCENPRGYYPYVRQCPGGWRVVTPAPPPDTGG